MSTDDLRIARVRPLLAPAILSEEIPVTRRASEFVAESRRAIETILDGRDRRLLAIVGPCSIHDTRSAVEYAAGLRKLADSVHDRIFIVMRVYFEKPRTIIGWKGLINDPDLDGSYHINKGLRLARQLLADLAEMGMPAGTEFLDTTFGQFFADLVSWGAIGARTVESQVHRELASGLSMPVGFKNRTDGRSHIGRAGAASVSFAHEGGGTGNLRNHGKRVWPSGAPWRIGDGTELPQRGRERGLGRIARGESAGSGNDRL
jgi:3-deoxy-7-phosphoheptulonate synthase